MIMESSMLKPIQDIIRRGGPMNHMADRVVRLLEEWPIWDLPIRAPTHSWLWHEMTSMHGVDDTAFQVWLNLPDNQVLMLLRGAIEKRGRLVVLPWET
jgi:hypothetical protein